MKHLASRLRSIIVVSVVACIARAIGRRISDQSVKNNHGQATSLSQTLDSLTAKRGATAKH
ncbi:hypothetical protein [Sanguibacter antarcticus]|uniref:Uncharacterized protein n=1 Tax=Sanguibacter antarcticus TaxID=372484 RepID=A0A2A9E8D5_9MICO|nr:hypothetical protein [Sanguibacter antarcticus]PFG34492.1 hypothetical protein ATL42_2402 [Sanguibacter antarcticus]